MLQLRQNLSRRPNYVVPNLIAKKSKPFSDGEFIKECMESVADIICPHKKYDISKISVPHQIIARRTGKLGESVEKYLINEACSVNVIL